MDRLLIAVQSDIFADFLAKSFRSEYEIRTCCDGCEALTLLGSFRPHAAILSLCLPRKDCITILEQSCYIPPVILGIADHNDPYGFRAAHRLGMDRILVTPTANAISVALSQMRLENDEKSACDPVAQTRLMLHCLGFLPNLDGFSMLCIAIPLCAEDPTRQLSNDIYPIVADKLNCNVRSVEASIRRSVKRTWERRDDAVWAKYFRADRTGAIPCPNNSLFIKRLAQQIRL